MGNDLVRELAAMPPGPTLAALLEGVDPGTLTPEQAVPVWRAWSRQRAHDHARMAATMARVAALSRRATGPTMGEWAGVEIAAALTWSDAKAARELGFAEALAGLPLVAAAFDGGRIDDGKAWVFTDVLGSAELTAAQIDALCATYVPVASGLTAGQLRHRLVRAVLAIDPDAAARRYRRAVRARGVVGYLAADGTAVITASGLPADQAAAACARVDALADRLRRAGCPGTITQIRTDVFLRLLDGRLTGLSAEEIITTLLADAAGSADAAADDTSDNLADDDPDGAAAAPGAAGATGDAPASAAGVEATSVLADRPGTLAADGYGDDRVACAGAQDGRSSGGAPAGVEIRVGLATLLGLDRRPGEIPGWGPVLPDTARDLVGRYHRAPWRFAVVDDEGHLLLAGGTRHRPNRPDAGRQPAAGGLVELHVTATLLHGLDPAAHPRWAAVITDLARPVRRSRPVARRARCPPRSPPRAWPAASPYPGPRPHLHRTRLPPPRPHLPRRSHPRPHRRRPDHPRQHRPAVSSPSRPQAPRGLAPPSAAARPVPLDQPARRALPHVRRARHAPAARPAAQHPGAAPRRTTPDPPG